MFSQRLQQTEFVEELVEGVRTEVIQDVYGRDKEGEPIFIFLG